MGAVKSFEDLRVYALARELALDVHALSREWPREELFGLTSQVRRSSRSVCANIAESWYKRRYPKHFASKLSDATAEAAETLVHISFAVDLNYLSVEDGDRLRTAYRRVIGGLVKMMTRPNHWSKMPPLREPEFRYVLGAGNVIDSLTH